MSFWGCRCFPLLYLCFFWSVFPNNHIFRTFFPKFTAFLLTKRGGVKKWREQTGNLIVVVKFFGNLFLQHMSSPQFLEILRSWYPKWRHLWSRKHVFHPRPIIFGYVQFQDNSYYKTLAHKTRQKIQDLQPKKKHIKLTDIRSGPLLPPGTHAKSIA